MRRIPWLGIAAVAMIAAGIVIALVGRNTLRWAPPPAPPAWAASRSAPTARTPSAPASADQANSRRDSPSAQAAQPSPSGLPASAIPVGVDIPAINVHAGVISLGLDRNGTIAVPPLSKPGVAGWYDRGPAPGQDGAAAILGHVDATGVGPAVFYNLGKLRPGAKIYVRLRDGQTVIFETYSVALYSKSKFPTAKVFGYTNWPTLRLITCGGEFDRNTGHYVGNVVAFASYVGSVG